MTWRPSANILRPGRANTDQGCYPRSRPKQTWPSSALNGGGDYSIDFDELLAPSEFITSFRFEAGESADLGWTNLFGTIATAWMRWRKPGLLSVTICALTNHGASHQVEASISVSPKLSLFPASLPPAPIIYDPKITGDALDKWLMTLPTDPKDVETGWFNNGGIPTRLGSPS